MYAHRSSRTGLVTVYTKASRIVRSTSPAFHAFTCAIVKRQVKFSSQKSLVSHIMRKYTLLGSGIQNRLTTSVTINKEISHIASRQFYLGISDRTPNCLSKP